MKEKKLKKRGKALLERWGIKELYPPQSKALPYTLDGQNVLVAVPTAAGKTLIAYITLAERLKTIDKALYIVPLKALAMEKYRELKVLQDFGLKIALSIGDYDSEDEYLSRYNIVVATSEKADSLLRHRAKWIEDLKVVVADEIHLLGDPSRGSTLEVTLSRIMSLNPRTQIIGLSATVKNAEDIANWLKARLIRSDFRPVELREGIYLDGELDFPTYGKVPIKVHSDDPYMSLVTETVKDGGQVLSFLSTRRSAEFTAERAGKYVSPMVKKERSKLREYASSLEGEESSRVIGRLARILPKGVAFHHAGLSNKAREIVEEAFKNGLLKALFATPTLAAGINLPARRVVIRDLTRYDANLGPVYLPTLEVKQMCGRAGRPQYDPWGEAVLIARNPREKEELLSRYILGEPEPIYSSLGNEKALRSHILASFASGFSITKSELMDFLENTLFAYQMDIWKMEVMMEETMEFLFKEGFLREEGQRITATDLGKRTSRLYLDPLSAVIMRDSLLNEPNEGALEVSYLQVISYVPDMIPLFARNREVGALYRFYENFKNHLFIEMPQDPLEQEMYLASLKSAKFLMDWIQETPEEELERRYNIGPGDIHGKVEVAHWLLTSMRELARLFNTPQAREIDKLILRVDYGIKDDLTNLVRVRGIGRVRARILFREGIKTIEDLKVVSPIRIASLPGFGEALARNILSELGVDFCKEKTTLKLQRSITDY